jgi:hypothetical protein
MDNFRYAPWSCQTDQDTSRTPKHGHHCTVPVPVVACGFSGTVRKCSSLVAFEIRNDSMEVVMILEMAVMVMVMVMVMVVAVLSAIGGS